MIDFEVVKKTKLRQKGEIQRIFDVSLPMVNAYLRHSAYPRGDNRVRIGIAVAVMEDLLAQEKLPFRDGVDPGKRALAIEKITLFVRAKTKQALERTPT